MPKKVSFLASILFLAFSFTLSYLFSGKVNLLMFTPNKSVWKMNECLTLAAFQLRFLISNVICFRLADLNNMNGACKQASQKKVWHA